MDIQRYLNDEPVQACPPSTAYRFRKFAGKHKVLIGASGLLLAMLVLGLAGTTWQAIRASIAEGKANQFADAERSAREAAQLAERTAQKNANEAKEQATAARKSADEASEVVKFLAKISWRRRPREGRRKWETLKKLISPCERLSIKPRRKLVIGLRIDLKLNYGFEKLLAKHILVWVNHGSASRKWHEPLS